jgi:hypothetical protein
MSDPGECPGHPIHYVEMRPGTRVPLVSFENDFRIEREKQRNLSFGCAATSLA